VAPVVVTVALADRVKVVVPLAAVIVAPAGIPGPLTGIPTNQPELRLVAVMLLLPDVTLQVTAYVIALNKFAYVVRDIAEPSDDR
jgi:hypothetical protein